MDKKSLCNFCGKEMDQWDEASNFTIHTKIGYGSRHDGDAVTLNLCCECFDNIAESCFISPFLSATEDE